MELLLSAPNYNDHNWQICGDLKVDSGFTLLPFLSGKDRYLYLYAS